jgi:Mce-associated membrane protein
MRVPTGESDDVDVVAEDVDVNAIDDDVDEVRDEPVARSLHPTRLALTYGIVLVLALGALCGWLGHRATESQRAEDQRRAYVEAARQGAVTITSIDYQRADADVQRILDSSTGQFHDEFAGRAAEFLDAAKKSQSTSVGTITAAGIESMAQNGATVLVAVTVNTSQIGAAELPARSWRMRMTLQGKGRDVRVSRVEFV